RNHVCTKIQLHAAQFSQQSEHDLHRLDMVDIRLRHNARQQGIHLPGRAIFGKGRAFIS
ncbi:DNA-binding response regulator, partial [Klebsiella pneumoniae]|nr:DNA-binding response regulator [Klebsiella pneumoniae]